MDRPGLQGANGEPLQGADGLLVPHARTFAAVYNAVNRTYHWRWDEALKHSQENALAMGRDLFVQSLLQERASAVVNSKWHLEVDDDKDPRQTQVRDGLMKLVKRVPRFKEFTRGLHQNGTFIGRQGSQVEWGKTADGVTVVRHAPVHGDKIQYQWDGTPVVLIGHEAARYYESQDKDAVVRLTDPAARPVITTDRGGYGLRLHTPEWRRRFVIHTHHVQDADFFEGDLAGGVHGVGLRHYVYWAYWLQMEVFDWLFSTMEQAGTMDLYLFNYDHGNAAAKTAAENNAKQLTTKLAFAVPRTPGSGYPSIETVPYNASGAEVLKGILQEFFRRDVERMIVGQSMSAGMDDTGALGGTGRAEFAKDTKFQLVQCDADYLAETLTTDLLEPMKAFNYPWADFPVRLCYEIDDPENAERLAAGISLIGVGVAVKADELRAAGGYTKPADGDEVVGGLPMGPDGQPIPPDQDTEPGQPQEGNPEDDAGDEGEEEDWDETGLPPEGDDPDVHPDDHEFFNPPDVHPLDALGDAIVEELFTGTEVDSLGREIRFVNGKRVPTELDATAPAGGRAATPGPTSYAYNPAQSRGQPENAGEFGPSGGGQPPATGTYVYRDPNAGAGPKVEPTPSEPPSGPHPPASAIDDNSPLVQGALGRLKQRAGEIAQRVNEAMLRHGVGPEELVGTFDDWCRILCTKHADVVGHACGLDATTAAHLLTHVATKVWADVKGRLKGGRAATPGQQNYGDDPHFPGGEWRPTGGNVLPGEHSDAATTPIESAGKPTLHKILGDDPHKVFAILRADTPGAYRRLDRLTPDEHEAVHTALHQFSRRKVEKIHAELHGDWHAHLRLHGYHPGTRPEDVGPGASNRSFAKLTAKRLGILSKALADHPDATPTPYALDQAESGWRQKAAGHLRAAEGHRRKGAKHREAAASASGRLNAALAALRAAWPTADTSRVESKAAVGDFDGAAVAISPLLLEVFGRPADPRHRPAADVAKVLGEAGYSNRAAKTADESAHRAERMAKLADPAVRAKMDARRRLRAAHDRLTDAHASLKATAHPDADELVGDLGDYLAAPKSGDDAARLDGIRRHAARLSVAVSGDPKTRTAVREVARHATAALAHVPGGRTATPPTTYTHSAGPTLYALWGPEDHPKSHAGKYIRHAAIREAAFDDDRHAEVRGKAADPAKFDAAVKAVRADHAKRRRQARTKRADAAADEVGKQIAANHQHLERWGLTGVAAAHGLGLHAVLGSHTKADLKESLKGAKARHRQGVREHYAAVKAEAERYAGTLGLPPRVAREVAGDLHRWHKDDGVGGATDDSAFTDSAVRGGGRPDDTHFREAVAGVSDAKGFAADVRGNVETATPGEVFEHALDAHYGPRPRETPHAYKARLEGLGVKGLPEPHPEHDKTAADYWEAVEDLVPNHADATAKEWLKGWADHIAGPPSSGSPAT